MKYKKGDIIRITEENQHFIINNTYTIISFTNLTYNIIYEKYTGVFFDKRIEDVSELDKNIIRTKKLERVLNND